MLDFKLYAITDRWLAKNLMSFASEAAGFGLRALRMRERDLGSHAAMKLALDLRDRMRGKKFFVSSGEAARDAAGIAAGFAGIVFANGFHVPERGIGSDWTPERVRGPFPGMLCGVSVHSLEAAQRAEAWGADFLTFGAVFEAPSKRAMGFEPQGLANLKQVVNAVGIPVFAIGGVTPAGARLCVDQGAWGVAVIRDLLVTPDLGARLAEYREVLGTL